MIKTVLSQLFIKQWTGYSLLLGVLALIGACTIRLLWLYPLSFLLITNFFDMLGYGKRCDVIAKYSLELYQTILPYYRIAQKLTNALILLVIWFITENWLVALACFASNFGGMQDVLYYFFGRYNFNQSYTWLRWTPLGILIGDLNKWEFVVQGIVWILLITISLEVLC